MNRTALLLSFRLAATTSLLLLVLGVPVAYWLAFSRPRWKFLVEALVALPLVLPPTVLGFYFLLLLGQQSPLGRTVTDFFGTSLPFSFAGLVIASLLYSFPFAVQPMAAGFAAVDQKLIHSSELLGASRLRTFFRIILPLARPAVVTGFVLSFAHTLGEFGVVLMVGGNIPGATRTLSIAIYDNVQELDYHAANLNSLALLAFSFSVLAVVYGLNRNRAEALRRV